MTTKVTKKKQGDARRKIRIASIRRGERLLMNVWCSRSLELPTSA